MSTSNNDYPDEAAIKTEVERQREEMGPLPLEEIRESMDICCGSAVPGGWIKTNDHWNPTICGNPGRIVYNVCTISRYDNKPIGARMTVCASAPTPPGWVIVDKFWNPTKCGHPRYISNNMKVIKRVS